MVDGWSGGWRGKQQRSHSRNPGETSSGEERPAQQDEGGGEEEGGGRGESARTMRRDGVGQGGR